MKAFRRRHAYPHQAIMTTPDLVARLYGEHFRDRVLDVVRQWELNRRAQANEVEKAYRAALRAADKHARANPPINATFRLNADELTHDTIRSLLRAGVQEFSEFTLCQGSTLEGSPSSSVDIHEYKCPLCDFRYRVLRAGRYKDLRPPRHEAP